MTLAQLCRQLKGFLAAGIIDEPTAAAIVVEKYPQMELPFATQLLRRMMTVLR